MLMLFILPTGINIYFVELYKNIFLNFRFPQVAGIEFGFIQMQDQYTESLEIFIKVQGQYLGRKKVYLLAIKEYIGNVRLISFEYVLNKVIVLC